MSRKKENRYNRQFVIGDIHGASRALEQCLKKSGFQAEKDLLVCLGDVCDGWPDVHDVIETLLKIPHLVYIIGNHDHWALEWMKYGLIKDLWLNQGGLTTINSYKGKVPESHINFLTNANPYLERTNKLFIHGGFDFTKSINQQDSFNMMWDRSLAESALANKDKGFNLSKYDEIYIGHTPTINFGTTMPIKACEVWMMDTGAGWSGGILTMMNIDTKEIFQSDRVDYLYPEYIARNKIRI